MGAVVLALKYNMPHVQCRGRAATRVLTGTWRFTRALVKDLVAFLTELGKLNFADLVGLRPTMRERFGLIA
jgi:hypothetical protein